MRIRQIADRLVALTVAMLATACGGDSPVGPGPIAPPPAGPPVLTSVSLSIADDPIEVGQFTSADAAALDQFGAPIAAAPATFSSTSPEVAGVSPTLGVILAIAPGTTRISATIEGKTAERTITVVTAQIRINEIAPNGDTPGGFVEFFNPTGTDVDMGGWMVSASDVFQTFTVPAGAVIPAGGFLAVNEGNFPAGLRASDAVHLFSRFGVQVDGFAWTVNPPGSYARCPDGSGAFVVTAERTRKAPNSCDPPTP